MTERIVSLFPKTIEPPNVNSLQEILNSEQISTCTRGLVIGIKDIGHGKWDTHIEKANLSNAEALLALDIARDTIISSVLGR